MTTIQTLSLEHIINTARLKLDVTHAPRNPNMPNDQWSLGARHWFCVLTGRAGKMEFYFSQGAAHTKPPTLPEILDCLASDAATVENARSFEDFAAELGYDPDSRAAEKTYNICRKQAMELANLLGSAP